MITIAQKVRGILLNIVPSIILELTGLLHPCCGVSSGLGSLSKFADKFAQNTVIPAETGIHSNNVHPQYWIPAFAGMTVSEQI